MKKVIYAAIIILIFPVVLASCKKDNLQGPNAQFYGAILDNVGNSLVEQDLVSGSTIQAVELGYPSEVTQFWLIKNTGEFRNNFVFSNYYRLSLVDGNFFPIVIDSFFIHTGANNYNFQVTPYIRVKDWKIIHDENEGKITATFRLEAGGPGVALSQIRLYSFTDIYVGAHVALDPKGGSDRNSFAATPIDNEVTYTLSIDLNANAGIYKAGRDYYFRIGALADIADVGIVRNNYSQYVKISL